MPQLSSKKKDKISEQILSYLFSSSPEPQYTVTVAEELARDEEFIKSLLQELEQKKLVIKVTKSPQGVEFTRRQRWRLSNAAFDAYSRMQRSRPQ
jgi:prolyl-tRNA editing enzyme YbaK/EbsC (Cys-tRNA(Pro) deacylase)